MVVVVPPPPRPHPVLPAPHMKVRKETLYIPRWFVEQANQTFCFRSLPKCFPASLLTPGCHDIIGLDLGNSHSQWAVYVGDQLKSRTDTKRNQLGANMESPSYFNRDMRTGDLKRATPFPCYTKDTRELEFIPEGE